MADAYALAAKYDSAVLAEQFIAGRELTCAVLGQAERSDGAAADRDPRARRELRLPQQVLQRRHQVPLSRAGGRRAGRRDPAAVRARLRGARRARLGTDRRDAVGARNEPFLLELNTSPGMTSHSLVPDGRARGRHELRGPGAADPAGRRARRRRPRAMSARTDERLRGALRDARRRWSSVGGVRTGSPSGRTSRCVPSRCAASSST